MQKLKRKAKLRLLNELCEIFIKTMRVEEWSLSEFVTNIIEGIW